MVVENNGGIQMQTSHTGVCNIVSKQVCCMQRAVEPRPVGPTHSPVQPAAASASDNVQKFHLHAPACHGYSNILY
jgi:hypothetical protein